MQEFYLYQNLATLNVVNVQKDAFTFIPFNTDR